MSKETIRVLMVEDNPGDARLQAELLQNANADRYTCHKHSNDTGADQKPAAIEKSDHLRFRHRMRW